MVWNTLLVIYFSIYSFWIPSEKEDIWIVRSSSSLIVNGSTNINTFTCSVSSYGKTDTLHYFPNHYHQNKYKVKSILHVPVNYFDCQNRLMTKDLQKTLQVTKHPYIVIDIKYLSGPPDGNQKTVEGLVDISMAGAKKHFLIPFQVTRKQNVVYMKGKKQVLFSDFHLIPPSKLGGSIKVRNELQVEVTLVMHKLN